MIISLESILNGDFSTFNTDYDLNISYEENASPENVLLDLSAQYENVVELENILGATLFALEAVKAKSKKKGKIKKSVKKRKMINRESYEYDIEELNYYDTEESLASEGYEIVYENENINIDNIEMEADNIFEKILEGIKLIIKKIGEFFKAIFNFFRNLFQGGLAKILEDSEKVAKIKNNFAKVKINTLEYKVDAFTILNTYILADTKFLTDQLIRLMDVQISEILSNKYNADSLYGTYTYTKNVEKEKKYLFFFKKKWIETISTTCKPGTMLQTFIDAVDNGVSQDARKNIFSMLFGDREIEVRATDIFKSADEAISIYKSKNEWTEIANNSNNLIKGFDKKIKEFYNESKNSSVDKKMFAKSVNSLRTMTTTFYKFISICWSVYRRIHSDSQKCLEEALYSK